MRVAIVGCGHVSEQHLGALRRVPDIEIVGLCDRDGERGARVARAHRVSHSYDDLSKLLAETRPDVVHVLTPPSSHADVAMSAMATGCHVLVEKPMAVSRDEAIEMREMSRRQGVRLGVCHNFLFVPAFLRAKQLVQTGALGRVLSAEAFWKVTSVTPASRQEAAGWIKELPGGIVQEVAPHPIYLLAALIGDLELVSTVVRRDGALESGTELRSLFDSSAGPAVLGISVDAAPVQKFIRIYGTRMSLHIDLATSTLLRLRSRGSGISGRALVNLEQSVRLAAGTLGNAVRVVTGRLRRGHEGLIASFYEALRRGDEPPVGSEDGLAVVVVLERLCRAIADPGT